MSRTILWLATLGLFAMLASACATRTEVIIAVESDIPTLDRITITVTSPSGAMQSSMATFGTGAADLVRTLGVTYSSGPTGPFVATATGFRTGAQVILRSAVFEFVRGETRVIHLDLLARCQGVTCGAMQTCGEAGCRSQLLAPSELEPYTGPVPSHDAAASPTDGGGTTPDMGSAAPDTGSTPVMCAGMTCMLAHSSAPTCMMGRCTIGVCDTGFLNCDARNSTGCETDGTSDVDHCGDCGTQCRGGTAMCCHGTCAATCP